jgi:hypothetical protein
VCCTACGLLASLWRARANSIRSRIDKQLEVGSWGRCAQEPISVGAYAGRGNLAY